MIKLHQYVVSFCLLLALSCTENELPLAQPAYQISDYQRASPSRRFDQCTIRYAFRNKAKTADPAALKEALLAPFNRWQEANGYLTFEQVAGTAPADINIVFADSLRFSKSAYTTFGLVGQPIAALSQLVKAKTDSSCTIYLLGSHAWDVASLQRVLLFQLGAALGLATATNPASVMAGQQLNSLTALDSADVSAIRRVYSQPCDSWVRLASLPFDARKIETTAATPRVGYLLTYAGSVWEFTPGSTGWRSRALYPAAQNQPYDSFRRAFVIDSTLFVGDSFSYHWTPGQRGAFWQYLPANNQWARIDSIGQLGYGASQGFALNGKGYIVMGYPGSTETNGLVDRIVGWTYDPGEHKWTKPVSYERPTPKTYLSEAWTFVVQNEAYLMGVDAYLTKCWRFSPNRSIPWTEIAVVDNVSYESVGFAVRNAGYTFGNSFYGSPSFLMKYTPDQGWQRLNDFPGEGRATFSFAIGNRAYVGTNKNEFWMYIP